MSKKNHTWEEAIILLRKDPKHNDLIKNSYLGSDLEDNCERFLSSNEFKETHAYLKKNIPGAKKILDMPAGNGIASYAFAREGYSVIAVEPDPSSTVGRGAIEFIRTKKNIAGIEIVEAYGEALPFPDASFDVVYVRQGLHHAQDLPKMLFEISRVLKKGGILFAAREHVVDDYKKSLEIFLSEQADHQLYGGENAFMLRDYVNAIQSAGLRIRSQLGPFDSIINLYPNDFTALKNELLNSKRGRILSKLLPSDIVYKIGLWRLKKKKAAGRLYSFIAEKI